MIPYVTIEYSLARHPHPHLKKKLTWQTAGSTSWSLRPEYASKRCRKAMTIFA